MILFFTLKLKNRIPHMFNEIVFVNLINQILEFIDSISNDNFSVLFIKLFLKIIIFLFSCCVLSRPYAKTIRRKERISYNGKITDFLMDQVCSIMFDLIILLNLNFFLVSIISVFIYCIYMLNNNIKADLFCRLSEYIYIHSYCQTIKYLFDSVFYITLIIVIPVLIILVIIIKYYKVKIKKTQITTNKIQSKKEKKIINKRIKKYKYKLEFVKELVEKTYNILLVFIK